MTQKRIYLHIGIEKTGTTTLQLLGRQNRNLFEKNGLLYPQSPGELAHTGLAVFISDWENLKNTDLSRECATPSGFAEYRDRLAGALKEEVNNSDAPVVWLSSEHLSSRSRGEDSILPLAEMLRAITPDIRVVVYLRNQADLYLSAVSTAIKSGARSVPKPPVSCHDAYFDFEALLHRYGRAFGKDALEVRIFDRESLRGGSIISDFCDAIGFHLPAEAALPALANRRLDRPALELIRKVNNLNHIRNKDGLRDARVGGLVRLLESRYSGPPLGIPGELREQLEAMFEEMNRRIAKDYFNSETSVFPQSSAEEGLLTYDLDADEALDRVIRCWVLREIEVERLRARIAELTKQKDGE